MPAARTKVNRQEKVQQILDAAECRALADGYDGMSVAAIARELGIAQNSVYWYFPSKDDLFVAAFRQILLRLGTRKPPRRAADRVVWVTDQLAQLAAPRSALRARAVHCDAAARLQSDLEQWIRALLLGELEARLDPAQAELAGQAFLAAVEGALSMNLPRSERRRVVAFVYARIAGG